MKKGQKKQRLLKLREIYDELRAHLNSCYEGAADFKGPAKKITDRAKLNFMAAMAIVASQMERTCIQCGCTDSNACNGGCAWVVIHKHTPTGVCTKCVDVKPKAIKRGK